MLIRDLPVLQGFKRDSAAGVVPVPVSWRHLVTDSKGAGNHHADDHGPIQQALALDCGADHSMQHRTA